MRPAPPLQISVDRFEVWLGSVLVSMGLVVATVALWLLTLHDDAALSSPSARVVVVVVASIGLGGAATLLAPRAFSLRWDGRQWHVGPVTSVGHEPRAGRLRVAVDTGGWMLLRFDAEPAGRLARPRWLPVQRSAPPHAWHALRCAVYSPRPESGDSSLDSADSASTPPPRPG